MLTFHQHQPGLNAVADWSSQSETGGNFGSHTDPTSYNNEFINKQRFYPVSINLVAKYNQSIDKCFFVCLLCTLYLPKLWEQDAQLVPPLMVSCCRVSMKSCIYPVLISAMATRNNH